MQKRSSARSLALEQAVLIRPGVMGADREEDQAFRGAEYLDVSAAHIMGGHCLSTTAITSPFILAGGGRRQLSRACQGAE